MIKLPKAIVIYPQKKSVPGYLLCWIPAGEYPRAVVDAELRSDHERFDPQGVEIELSDEGLEEAGVKLDASPDELRRTYLELVEAGVVPESGMVELADLMEVLEEEIGPAEGADDASAEAMISFDTERSGLRQGEEGSHRRSLLRKIAGGPPMSDGDEASQVYRRLNVRQQAPERVQEGG